jgi:hypothetical protein
MKLTKHELKLASEFLGQASEDLSENGCNDYSMENTDKNWALLQAAEDWNHTPKEHRDERPPAEEKIWTSDFFIAGYLAYRLAEAAK